ncbi:hypothetical protein ACFZ8E_02590 [Methylobacterium sp. HMF5984]|uniref:hypothetical protein n=1 Tax=Methylobacterium sp. HMF5984 TaxID=3367370 RepID=UPI0038530872
MIMKLFSQAGVALLLLSSSASSRALTSPSPYQIELLYRSIGAQPPDFDALARDSQQFRQASEFDRSSVLGEQTQRLRREYESMRDVDTVTLRVSGSFNEYDSANGGFPLDLFQPNIGLNFYSRAPYTVSFENYKEFSTWKIESTAARKTLADLRNSRSVVYELQARPFANDAVGENRLRMQVREVRILDPRNGNAIAAMKSNEALRPLLSAANAAHEDVPADKMEFRGLKIGDDESKYLAWVKSNYGSYSSKSFDSLDRLNHQFAQIKGVDIENRMWMGSSPQVMGTNLKCQAELDAERNCGTVILQRETSASPRKVTTIIGVQTLVGVTESSVTDALVRKYGNYVDSFETVASISGRMEGSNYRGKQFVWGRSFQATDKFGATKYTDQKRNWPIEAYLLNPEKDIYVLIVQLTRSPLSAVANADSGPKL